MRPSRRVPLLAVLCGGLALPLGAGGEEERRTFAVNVIDRDGNRVPGLGVADFRGEFRGRPVKILAVAADEGPRRIALLVDTSSGLHNREKALGLAWGVAEDLVGSLSAGERMVIVTVSDALQQRSQLTSDRAALLQAISRARAQDAGGASALYDGVVQVAQSFSAPSFGDVVYLISDGEDTASKVLDHQAHAALARTGLRVFVSLLPGRPRRSLGAGLVVSEAESWSRAVADATGGIVVHADGFDVAEATRRSRRVHSLISQAYRVEVAFPTLVDKPRDWKLELVDEKGSRVKDVELVYPRVVVPSGPR